MDEREWLACECPGELIDELNQRDAASRRKFRLFSCACARLVWHLMPDVGRTAVEVAERAADGLTTEEEREAAQDAAENAFGQYSESDPRFFATLVAARASWVDGRQNHGNAEGAAYVVSNVVQALALEAGSSDTGFEAVARDANRLQCRLFHEVMGNPFRPVTVDPSWLAWKDRPAVKFVEGIYADRAFDRLPILADALEEAGCSDEAVLGHCRQPGNHVRGCWVVDLLLGKG